MEHSGTLVFGRFEPYCYPDIVCVFELLSAGFGPDFLIWSPLCVNVGLVAVRLHAQAYVMWSKCSVFGGCSKCAVAHVCTDAQ